MIRGWLDPVVAGKVHFTNNRADLAEFIEPSQMLKELGGDEDWEYEYVEPVPGENDTMKDAEARSRLLEARENTVKQFESATLDWIQDPEGEKGQAAKARRDQIATQLREQYWKLDPYVRARSLYDRLGIISSDGKVTWNAVTTSSTGQTQPEPSADDVD